MSSSRGRRAEQEGPVAQRLHCSARLRPKEKPRRSGAFRPGARERNADGGAVPTYDTFGSLKASISPAKALIGTQLQNTFLSPYTLSTRATGGQYFCSLSTGSGKAASSRG